MEAFTLLCDVVAIVLVVYMGWRDDGRAPGTPQTSLFRTLDEAATIPGATPKQKSWQRQGKRRPR